MSQTPGAPYEEDETPNRKLNGIDKHIQTYNEKLDEYKLRKFTSKVKSFLELIPVVSVSISGFLKEYEQGRFLGCIPYIDVRKEITEGLR